MRKKFIALYGGTNLTIPQVEFVRYLAQAILKNPETTLVTGGFFHFEDSPQNRSTDRSAAEAALELLGVEGLKQRVETWLPEATKDRLEEKVIRFDDIGTVKRMKGKSALARRFFLANGVDAVVTISGEGNTEMVLELASTVGKPGFPLPFTQGDSGKLWKEQRAQVVKRFSLSEEFAQELEQTKLDSLPSEQKQHLASRIATALYAGIKRRCLVLMPFHEEPNKFYDQWLEPVVNEAGLEPIRIDREIMPGDIGGIFRQQVLDCDSVLADITEVNPNVMYEIGHAHAIGIEPLIFCRRKLNDDDIPFYLKVYKIETPETETPEGRDQLIGRIKTYLAGI